MGISIIIYRLSDIYLNQIRITLFGTTSDYQIRSNFVHNAIWIRLDPLQRICSTKANSDFQVLTGRSLLAVRNYWSIEE